VKQVFVIWQMVQVVNSEQFSGPDAATKLDYGVLVHRLCELVTKVLSGQVVCGFHTATRLPVLNQTATQVRFPCPTWSK
jgi:hypothetical protein